MSKRAITWYIQYNSLNNALNEKKCRKSVRKNDLKVQFQVIGCVHLYAYVCRGKLDKKPSIRLLITINTWNAWKQFIFNNHHQLEAQPNQLSFDFSFFFFGASSSSLTVGQVFASSIQPLALQTSLPSYMHKRLTFGGHLIIPPDCSHWSGREWRVPAGMNSSEPSAHWTWLSSSVVGQLACK